MFILSNGMGLNRIAFSFPRGYGTAVERNYSRRLSREAYRLVKQDLIVGYDVMVLIFPGNDCFITRKTQLTNLFVKSSLLSEKT
jgi:ribonuclease P protein component